MKVAVIIAAYQADPGWLWACLTSIRISAARTPAVELDIRIGVDRCYETAPALEWNAQPYHWSPVNVGPYVMRNSLIALAPADAFVIFDADDVMLTEYFDLVLPALYLHRLVGPGRLECDEHLGGGKKAEYRHGVCAFRPDVLTTLGGYKAERLAADVDFIARAEQAGIHIHRIGQPCYLRRRHPASLTNAVQTRRGSSERNRATRRMERERMGAGSRVYVEPVTTPLEYRGVEVTA